MHDAFTPCTPFTRSEQNSEQEAYELMDYSLSRGVNFFDTAEL